MNNEYFGILKKQPYQNNCLASAASAAGHFTNQARVIARAEMVEELTNGLDEDDFSVKMSLLKGSGFMTKQVFDKWQELFR